MWRARDSDFRDEGQSRVYPRLAGCEELEHNKDAALNEKKMIIPDLDLLTDEQFQERIDKMRDDHQKTLELCDKLGIYEKEESINMKPSLPIAVVDNEYTLSTATFTNNSPVRSPDFVRKNFKATKSPSFTRRAKSADVSLKCQLENEIRPDNFEGEDKEMAEYKLKRYLNGLDYAKSVYNRSQVNRNGIPKHSCIDSIETMMENNKNLSKTNKNEWRHRVTIPKPFQMTVREMSRGAMKTKAQELWEKEKERRELKEMEECQKKFKAAPLPANIYIPLYDELQKKKAQQRHENHMNRKEYLLSSQNPFMFIEREKRKQIERHEKLKHLEEADMKHPNANFRAKPFPKKIFEDGVYEKMRNEEEMRLLRMDLRAEELLTTSSLPGNMTKEKKKHICALSEPHSPPFYQNCFGTDSKDASNIDKSPFKGKEKLKMKQNRWPATHLSANVLSRSLTDLVNSSTANASPKISPRKKNRFRGNTPFSSDEEVLNLSYDSDEIPHMSFMESRYGRSNDCYDNKQYLHDDHFYQSYCNGSDAVHYRIA